MDSKSAPALGSVLAAFFVAAAGTAFAQPIAAPRAASLVEQHALAQQGLSIGLLTALFEIQLNMSVTSGKEDVCRHHLPAPATSGSFKFLRKDVATDTLDLVGELYYDRDCQNRYAHVHYTAQRQSCCLSTVTETATLYGPTGKKLGKVELTGSVRQFLNLRFSSTGTFTPVQGGELRFGYTCAFDFIPTFGRVPCRIAVVQTFASTGNDIASITPVNFMMNNDLSATLVARNAELAIGAGGSLGISVPNLTTLMITGDATPIGIGAGRGSLAEFSAFL
jgi:hypothetical protein